MGEKAEDAVPVVWLLLHPSQRCAAELRGSSSFGAPIQVHSRLVLCNDAACLIACHGTRLHSPVRGMRTRLWHLHDELIATLLWWLMLLQCSGWKVEKL